jgi:hypothetical protein
MRKKLNAMAVPHDWKACIGREAVAICWGIDFGSADEAGIHLTPPVCRRITQNGA